MFWRFFIFLLRSAWRTMTSVLWLLSGVFISALLRFGPYIFRASVVLTLWSLNMLDRQISGRLSRSSTVTILAAGGSWAFVTILLPLAISLLLKIQPLIISPPLIILGFGIGLVFGVQILRLPVWGRSIDGDDLQLGEVGGLSLGFNKHAGVTLGQSQRATTLWTLGQPGVGKSRALASWVMADINAGRGVGFIDPHEDTFYYILKQTSADSQKYPNLAERVVIINPLDETWAPGFNPLQLFESSTPERIAGFFSDVALKIWKLDSSQAPRMSWLMAHTFLALAELGLTLVELPVFLRDSEWRNRVVERLDNVEVRDYFLKEYPTNERLRQEWMQSTINKIGQFVMDPAIRLILGQRKSTVDFREIMDSRRVLLVNLSKGRLGVENSQLFGAFLVAQIQQAALSRADTEDRPEFYLYLDEFQNYTTDHIQEILSESRKYNLSLVISHQYLAQLPPEQKQAVMNTYGTLVCFRIGYQDAEEVVREIFLPNLDPVRNTTWQFQTHGRLPLWLPQKRYGTVGDEWESHIRQLTGLKHREFWVKQRGSSLPIKQRTLEMPGPEYRPEALEALVTLSGIRYARKKGDVERELMIERPRFLSELAGGHAPNGFNSNYDDFEIWSR